MADKTSLEKITAGLAGRERARSNPFATATIVSAASLASLREEHATHVREHAKHIKAATDKIADFDARQAKELANYEYRAVVGNSGNVARERRPASDLAGFRETQKRDRIAFVAQARAGATAVAQPNRLRMQEIAAAIRASSGMFSALALASSHELGSERRSRLYAEMKDMGPQALLHVAQKAASEGDTLMAAVAIAVNDSMDQGKRPFVSADLAAQAFGSRAASAREHIEHVTSSHAATLAAEQALTATPNDFVAKIARGVESRITNADKLADDRRAELTE